jgi:predicted nucleotidyltransferase
MKRTVTNFNELKTFLSEEGILKSFGLKRIGVFGSFARGESFQDIDILIEDDIEFSKALLFKETLEKKLNVTIDIMLKKFAEPIILFRASKDIKYATAD